MSTNVIATGLVGRNNEVRFTITCNGLFHVFINGIHRTTRKTRKGAFGVVARIVNLTTREFEHYVYQESQGWRG